MKKPDFTITISGHCFIVSIIKHAEERTLFEASVRKDDEVGALLVCERFGAIAETPKKAAIEALDYILECSHLADGC